MEEERGIFCLFVRSWSGSREREGKESAPRCSVFFRWGTLLSVFFFLSSFSSSLVLFWSALRAFHPSSCLKHAISPPVAKRGARKKQRERGKKARKWRHCCFLFFLPRRSIAAEGKTFFFFFIFSLTKNRILAFLL